MFSIFAACEKTVADIVFLLDESGSVTSDNFPVVKNFVIDVIQSLKIGRNNVRVGVYTFSTIVRRKFYLNEHFDKRRLQEAIKRIPYYGGGTNTHLALETLRISAFKEENGDRKNAPNIAIIITDGQSSNKTLTILESSRLKKENVVMFSIGIGNNLRELELKAMASEPVPEHMFTVDNFGALQGIANKITTKTCEGNCISQYMFVMLVKLNHPTLSFHLLT